MEPGAKGLDEEKVQAPGMGRRELGYGTLGGYVPVETAVDGHF